jgi:hypothetical protein
MNRSFVINGPPGARPGTERHYESRTDRFAGGVQRRRIVLRI